MKCKDCGCEMQLNTIREKIAHIIEDASIEGLDKIHLRNLVEKLLNMIDDEIASLITHINDAISEMLHH